MKPIKCGCYRVIEYPQIPHTSETICPRCGANLASDLNIDWPPRPENLLD